MNKHLYRIVFNQARGLLMAVAECASSHSDGRHASSSPDSGGGRHWASLRPLTFALWAAMGLLAGPAIAQIVADPSAPRNQQPTILNAANGVPQVNIQTPSAAGVSRNTYNQFDVANQGAILNNSRTNAQTQLGGWVQGNPWLAAGTAKVILNEVNSNNPSLLRGYVEVAGDRAQVVIANPAGISCNGCGFINANRITLTTGTPVMNGGNLESYLVQRGIVKVEGAGLDASRADFTDIIARAVEVNAGIWANTLKVSTGANQVSADHTQTTPTNGTGSAPAYAIDVSSLGGMYAGKIALVGTEHGLGVRNAGQIGAMVGEVTVTADGQLRNSGHLTATTDLRIDTQSGVANSGTVYAGGNTRIDTRGDIQNTGTLAARGNTSLIASGTSSRIDSQTGAVLAAGLKDDGTLGSTGALQASATADIAAHGQTLAGGDMSLSGSAIDVSGSQTSGGNISLTARAGDVNATTATVQATRALAVAAGATLRTDAAQVSAEQLTVTGSDLSNVKGQLIQTGAASQSIHLPGRLDNTSGRIASNASDLTLSAKILDNTDGHIEHAGTGTLTLATTTLTAPRGLIQSNGALDLTAQTAKLDGATTSASRIKVDADTLSLQRGTLLQTGTGATMIRASTRLVNSEGNIASNGTTTLTVGDLLNVGGVLQTGGASLTVTATGAADNSAGQILSGGILAFTARSLTNTEGELTAYDILSLTATQAVDNTRGLIAANNAATLTAASLDNTGGTVQSASGTLGVTLSGNLNNSLGQVTAGQDLRLATADVSNSGTLYGQGDLTVSATGTVANTAILAARGHTTLTAHRLDSSAAGLIAAGLESDGSLAAAGDLAITTTQALNAHGQTLAGRGMSLSGSTIDLAGSQTSGSNISLTAGTGDVNATSATVQAAQTLAVAASATLRTDADQVSADRLTITAHDLSNIKGQLIQTGTASQSIQLPGHLDNTAGRIASNAADLTLSASTLDNSDGRIEHAGAGTLAINAATLTAPRGLIQGNGALDLAAQTATLDGATTSAARVTVDAATFSHRGGTLLQTGTEAMTVRATTRLDNTGGTLASNGATSFTVGDLVNAGGVLQAGGGAGVTVTASGTADNSAGRILAGGALSFTARSLTNTDGQVTAGDTLSLTATQAVDNTRGLIAANHAAILSVGSLANTRGTVQSVLGDLGLTLTGNLDNAQGQVMAGQDLHIRAADLGNSGTIYSQGDLTVAATGTVTNSAILAAQGHATLTARRLDSSTAGLIAAGLKSDGSLATAGDFAVTATQALNAHGQVMAAGDLTFDAASVDLGASRTQAANLGITARQGDVGTVGAVLATPGTLRITAKSESAQTLDNRKGELAAVQLDLQISNLDNRQGTIIQTGIGPTRLAMASPTGRLDNAAGRIASNAADLTLSASTLDNSDGHIEHAGIGTLAIHATTLTASQGLIQGNGTLDLTAQTAVLDGATTSAAQVRIDTETFSHRDGRLIQAGTGAMDIRATTRLDNTAGMLASNGNTTFTIGELTNAGGVLQAGGHASLIINASGNADNRAGKVLAGDTLSFRSQSLANADGQITAGGPLSMTAVQAVDNTRGLIATNNAASLAAASLDNTQGTVQSVSGTLGVTLSGNLANQQGQLTAGQDLRLAAADLSNSGTLYGQGNLTVSTTGTLTNTAILAAQGHATFTVGRLDSSAAGLIAAGMKNDGSLATTGDLAVTAALALNSHGQVMAAGDLALDAASVDLGASRTQAANIGILARQGDVGTASAVLATPGTLAITARTLAGQTLDNRSGQLAAGFLDFQVSNLDNRQGEIIQVGTGATRLAMASPIGRLDNAAGRIASNGADLTVSASTLDNTDGHIEHAGTGTLAIAATTLTAPRGLIQGNGALELATQSAILNSATTSAARVTVEAATFSHRGGTLLQTGTGATTVRATTRLDNAGGTIASNGATHLTVGDLVNAGGVLQAGGGAGLTVTASGAADNSAGRILAGGSLAFTARSLTNTDGQVTAGDTLSLTATQAVDNTRGLIAANHAATLTAASLNNASGQIGSVSGDLALTANTGAITNTAGRIEAGNNVTLSSLSLGNIGGIVSGQAVSLNSRGQSLDNTHGAIAARSNLTIQSGALVNDAGTIQAAGALSINTGGQSLTNTNSGVSGGILGQGTVALQAGSLDNRAGFIGAKDTVSLTTTQIDNRLGNISGERALNIATGSLDNRGGQIQALGDIVLNAGNGTIDNRASLIRSGGTASLWAGTVFNSDTQGTNQGIEGRSLTLYADQVSNRDGALRADQAFAIVGAGTVDNTRGLISSGKTLGIRDSQPGAKTQSIVNTGGTLIAGQQLDIDSASLTGDGKVLSQGNLSAKLTADYTHTGQFEANGAARLETAAILTNQASLQAGTSLVLKAATLDNQANGNISAGQLHLTATDTHTLTNRGLIDGSDVFIDAITLNNLGTGRIYGDHVAIGATTLNNDVENGQAAVIAARNRLDIGAGTIVNREHALIFSAGDMSIGGSLDANHQATGSATSLDNASATIEAQGALSIAAGTLTNRNLHLTTQDVVVSTQSMDEHQGLGSPNRYPHSDAYMRHVRDSFYQWVIHGVQYDKSYEYVYTRTTTETQVTSTDPGQILSGQGMSISAGSFLNDKSSVIAGGALNVAAGSLVNSDGTGQRTVVDVGTTYYYIDHQPGGRNNDYTEIRVLPYSPAPTITTIALAPAVFQQNTQPASTGTQVAALSLGSVGQSASGVGQATAQVSTGSGPAATTTVGSTGTVSGAGVTAASANTSQGNIQTGNALSGTSPVNGPAAVNGNAVATASASTSQGSVQTGNVLSGSSPVNGPNAVNGNTVAAASANAPLPAGTRIEVPVALNGVSGVSTSGQPLVIRSVVPDTTLPNNALFRVYPESKAGYLVETDPTFANYRTWLSSDYLLQQLSIDPATTQKRLGDGFYEQKLVREQVAQLTGRRFVDGYANDEAQYRGLLEAGATVAKAWKLVPGVALSAAQLAQLTSDIVWLVEQDVTLPDGSRTRALVPQVYVRIQPGDLEPSGALLAGASVNMNVTGSLTNSGSIAGRDIVSLAAENLQNLGGRIVGNDVTLSARTDLDNLGGRIAAGSGLLLSAGRDINVTTTTHGSTSSQGALNNLDRVAGLYVTAPGGLFSTLAGRNLTLTAAEVRNDGEGGQTILSAGNNLTLGTLTESRRQDILVDSRNFQKQTNLQEVGSTVAAVGDIRLLAGTDLLARATTVSSEKGAITLAARRDLSLTAGEQRVVLDAAGYVKDKSTFSTRTRTTRIGLDEVTALGTTVSGETVAIASGQDITVRGSNVVSTSGTALSAGRDLVVEAAREMRDESRFDEQKKSGLMSSGGVGFTIGTRQTSTDTKGAGDTAAASTVGATNGNVILTAGRDYRQVGSDVLAPNGDIAIVGQRVSIEEARETSRSVTETKTKQSGLTLAVTSPVISAVQTAQQMQKAAKDTSDPRMKALAAANVAFAAKNAVGAIQAGQGDSTAQQAGGINVSLSIGSSKSQSTSTQQSDLAVGSNITAGGNLTVTAAGAGKDSHLTVQGSALKAGNDLTLAADNKVDLLAAANTSTVRSTNSSSSASVGVSFGTDGFLVNVGASRGKGKANGDDLTWTNTRAEAGNTLTIRSGGDTALKGAVATGERVVADVGGYLAIESLQDKSTYDSKQQNLGVSVSVGYGKVGGSVSASQSKIKSDYQSVEEQSALRAGDGGFQVAVAGDTDLKAGAITSTQTAVDANRNRFTTGGRLTTSDLENKAEYSAQSVGVSASFGSSVNPDQAQQSQPASMGMGAGFGQKSGSASSTTRAAISGIAGDTAARTGDAETGLQKIFDAGKVQKDIDAQMQITQAFGREAPKAVASFAQTQAADLRKEAGQESQPERRAELEAEAKKWDEGGAYRVALHTAVGGLAGGVSGALGAGATAAAAPLLDQLQDGVQGALKSAGAGDTVAKAAAQLVAGATAAGIGAAAGGGNLAGTAMGLNVDANNRQLHPSEIQRIKSLAAAYAARNPGMTVQEAQDKLMAQALRDVDRQFAEGHATGDPTAEQFLRQNATAFVDINGKQVLMFTPGTQALYNDSSVLAETRQTYAKDYASAEGKAPALKQSDKINAAYVATAKTIATGSTKGVANLPADTVNGVLTVVENVPKAVGADLGSIPKVPTIPYNNEVEEQIAHDTQAVAVTAIGVRGAVTPGINAAAAADAAEAAALKQRQIEINAQLDGEMATKAGTGSPLQAESQVAGTKPTTGETEATAIGKAYHAQRAASRREEGIFDLVNEPISNADGTPIFVERRVNLNTGEPLPSSGQQVARPDAVDFSRGLIVDDKPLGRAITKDQQEIIRFIRAYETSESVLPRIIGIERYDPITGKPVVTELYKPTDFKIPKE